MKLGIGAVAFGKKAQINLARIKRAEELGFDSAWTAEAYGNDAVSTAAWVLAQTTTASRWARRSCRCRRAPRRWPR